MSFTKLKTASDCMCTNTRSIYYLVFPNLSCHLPFADVAADGTGPASGKSSTVSCTLAKARTPISGIPSFDSGVGSAPNDAVVAIASSAGRKMMSALDVFFCRSEYVLPAASSRPAVGEDLSFNLVQTNQKRALKNIDIPCLHKVGSCVDYLTYVGGFSPSSRVTSSGGSSRSL